MAQFLGQVGQVEDGERDGIHGKARGCSEWRQWSTSVRLGFRYEGEKSSRGERVEARVCRGDLYGARTRLVTPSVEEEPPARDEGEHAVVLALMHGGEDEDELLTSVFDEGVSRADPGLCWPVLAGLLVGLCCWAAGGLTRPGKVQVGFSLLFFFLFLFSVLYFLFEFIFEFNTVCKYFNYVDSIKM
jgi:hypothetical protein